MSLADLIAGNPAPGSVAKIARIAVANTPERNPVDSGSVAKIARIARAKPENARVEPTAPPAPGGVATAISAISAIPAIDRTRAGLNLALSEAREGLPVTLAELAEAFGAEGEADWLEGYEPHCHPRFLRAFAVAVAERLERERAAETTPAPKPAPEPPPGPLAGLHLLREDREHIERRTRGRRNRETLLAEYARRWKEAAAAEPAEVRKANAGRFAANTWLREVGR